MLLLKNLSIGGSTALILYRAFMKRSEQIQYFLNYSDFPQLAKQLDY